MTRILKVAGVAMLLGAAFACSAPDDDVTPAPAASVSTDAGAAAVEAAIARLEEEWVQAIVAKDAAKIDRILAADFVGTTNDRRYVKRDALEDVTEGTHQVLRLDDVQVRVFGDTAVVDVDQTEQSRHGEEDFSGSYMFTNVWVKRDGEWKAVASHGSRVR